MKNRDDSSGDLKAAKSAQQEFVTCIVTNGAEVAIERDATEDGLALELTIEGTEYDLHLGRDRFSMNSPKFSLAQAESDGE